MGPLFQVAFRTVLMHVDGTPVKITSGRVENLQGMAGIRQRNIFEGGCNLLRRQQVVAAAGEAPQFGHKLALWNKREVGLPPRYRSKRNREGGRMLYWALVFLLIALMAGVLGFGGVAAASAGIAKILFFVFLVLFLIGLVMHLGRRGGSAI
jgi:uncharacterized membrane protein YtjA (UPF0391 family)